MLLCTQAKACGYRLVTFFFLTSSFFTALYAASPGSTALNYLKIGVGARAMGMGEAYTAVSDDASAMYWNPAGLKQVNANEILFMHTKWFEDMTYQYLYLVLPSFGIGISRMDYGVIQGYTWDGLRSTQLTAQDWLITFSDSVILKRFSAGTVILGANLKYMQEILAGYSAHSAAADLGLMFYRRDLRLGLAVKNMGLKMKFDREGFSLPATATFGLSYKTKIYSPKHIITASADFSTAVDQSFSFSAGAEYGLFDLLFLRAGYKSEQATGNGLRLGLGLKLSIFQFDAAYVDYGELNEVLKIGLSVRYGKKKSVTPPKEEKKTGMEAAQAFYQNGMRFYEAGRYLEAIVEFNKVLEIDPTNRQAIEMMRMCNERIR